MKVLIIERDPDSSEQLEAILKGMGAEVVQEPTKNNAIELLRKEPFDVILFDPAPQNEIRPFIMSVRRSTNAFPPILIIGSGTLELKDVLAAGGNELVKKPFDSDDVRRKVANAARITSVSRVMADESEDFRSKDGIIAKSAFNQLYITCLDRADRHGESAHIIFVSIENLGEIAKNDGQEEAEKVANNLRKTISRTRRTSDIAGHIKTAEFCLLLLRPMKEDESLMAASRFAETMKSNHDLISTAKTKAVLKIWVLDVPSGAIHGEHVVKGD